MGLPFPIPVHFVIKCKLVKPDPNIPQRSNICQTHGPCFPHFSLLASYFLPEFSLICELVFSGEVHASRSVRCENKSSLSLAASLGWGLCNFFKVSKGEFLIDLWNIMRNGKFGNFYGSLYCINGCL